MTELAEAPTAERGGLKGPNNPKPIPKLQYQVNGKIIWHGNVNLTPGAGDACSHFKLTVREGSKDVATSKGLGNKNFFSAQASSATASRSGLGGSPSTSACCEPIRGRQNHHAAPAPGKPVDLPGGYRPHSFQPALATLLGGRGGADGGERQWGR